jgi:antitoxin VapB
MALSVKNDEADRLARELAGITGESITEAIVVALRERLQRHRSQAALAPRLRRLVAEVGAYPVLDPRAADEILGYDERGLPT